MSDSELILMIAELTGDDVLFDIAEEMLALDEYYIELQREHSFSLRRAGVDSKTELRMRGISDAQLRHFHKQNIRAGRRDVTLPYINAIEGVEQVTNGQIMGAKCTHISAIMGYEAKRYLCPFHDDRNPSLTVKSGYYKCWSCGASGDMIDLDMKVNNRSFMESVRFLS